MSDPAVDPSAAAPADHPRKVLLVAGPGRSGTSTMAGLMKIMGLHVPQPEVAPDESNPKGFNEPQWVVDHHDRLLREANVQVSDARPDAWVETGRLCLDEGERTRTADWLAQHFAAGPELVVKDPRLSWFLGLWQVAAVRAGATPVFATMLRPPAEVVGSRQTYYQSRLGSAHLAASWLNMVLHTEHATREAVADGARVFVRYADLLDGWERVVRRAGEQLRLQHVLQAPSAAVREGDAFVTPGLRRMNQTLDDLGLPPRLHELVAQTWSELNRLAEPGGDVPEVHQALDHLRAGYVELYEEAAAISRSSAVAAEHRVKREQRRRAARDADAPTPGPAPAPVPAPVETRVSRIPHRVRAAVPAPVRRGLRTVLGRRR